MNVNPKRTVEFCAAALICLLGCAGQPRYSLAATERATPAALGIDAARLERDATVPDLGQTLDFGGAGCRTNPWAEAEAFLEERADSGLHFDVVLGSVAPGR